MLAQRYLHGPAVDQVLAQEDTDNTVEWHLTNHLGTVRDIIGNDGTVKNHLTYDSFGNVVAETDTTVDSRYLFTGREFDEETNLHYHRTRYYNAEIGSFISEDSIGMLGGTNVYSYGYNNPILYTDPFGLDVYVCGEGAFGQSFLPDHQWIKTDTIEAGMGGADGREPGNESGDYPGMRVEVTDHTGRSLKEGVTCKKIGGVDEDRVNEQLQLGRSLGRWWPTNQCRSFVNSVIQKSRTKEYRRNQAERRKKAGTWKKINGCFLKPPVCFDDFHCISYLCNLGSRAGFKNGQF